MEQDNAPIFYLPPVPQPPKKQLVHQAAGMLIIKLSTEFGSELPGSQGKN